MTKLEQLIKELCPNGVEYKKLDDTIISLKTGLNPRQNFSLNENESIYSYITGKDIFNNCINVTEKTDMITKEALELINKRANLESGLLLFASTGTGTVGRMAIIKTYNNDWGISETLYAIKVDDSIIQAKYLLHYLYSQNAKKQFEPKISKGSVPHLKVKDLLNVVIPVPPIEVQAEIVKILDNFTELTAKLTAELTARKKQYEYYRDELLSFGSDCEWRTLQTLAEIGTGNSNTNEAVEDGQYTFFVRSQEPLKKDSYEYDETAIITAGDGVGVGKVFHYVEGKYALHQRAYRIHIVSNVLMPKFFFYYMKATFYDYISKAGVHSSVSSIRKPMLDKYPIPLPSIEEQRRIVSILDRFDKLCNDISEGLPAEIEARRKQYEYYRDKLLSFEEVKV
ncbi:MAG: restriction endonuclease subunit S [Ruminococcus sp.]|nr:restriction endonuclease subunit S [Ruminococcus sp.]